jgi:hypothetical protein
MHHRHHAVDAVRLLQQPRQPALGRHQLGHAEDVELVGAVGHDRQVRVAQHLQPRDGLDAGAVGVDVGHQVARHALVALHAQVLEHGPGRRHAAGRPCADDGGGEEAPVGPDVDVEVVEGRQLRRAVEHRGRRLGAEAELVHVGRDRVHRRHAEVEGRDVAPDHLHERRQVAADAGVDVQPDPAALRQRPDGLDRVDGAVGKAGRRAHQHDGVGVDHRFHRRHVGAEVGAHRRAAHLQVHQLGGLLEGRVHRQRRHDVAAVLRVAALVARPVAAGLHRLDDAFGATGGHEALRLVGCVEQAQRHRHDLVLHLLHAGERAPGAERVLAEVLEEGRAAHLVQRLVGLEDEQRRAAVGPVAVTGLEAAHLGQDLVLRPPLLGHGHTHGVSLVGRRDATLDGTP